VALIVLHAARQLAFERRGAAVVGTRQVEALGVWL
jgi:hypothetical protein